ncbi:hypothetical protein HDF12_004277 [Edaphobacter lichenicola]|uniref:Uncharacterized protein n=1 Tax=Tunturiibacter lichenicola TaxID=2051959 RepID=A0A7Y9T4D6_9BACT|nr:hypothetical protein [Edaphobacter lichenicola]
MRLLSPRPVYPPRSGRAPRRRPVRQDSLSQKNKSQKPVTFFITQKHAAKPHNLTSKPPHSHHNFTTPKPPKSAKPPGKNSHSTSITN